MWPCDHLGRRDHASSILTAAGQHHAVGLPAVAVGIHCAAARAGYGGVLSRAMGRTGNLYRLPMPRIEVLFDMNADNLQHALRGAHQYDSMPSTWLIGVLCHAGRTDGVGDCCSVRGSGSLHQCCGAAGAALSRRPQPADGMEAELPAWPQHAGDPRACVWRAWALVLVVH